MTFRVGEGEWLLCTERARGVNLSQRVVNLPQLSRGRPLEFR